MSLNAHSSSFRDPSGFIFVEDGLVKRQINPIYFETYSALNEADFYIKAIEYKNQPRLKPNTFQNRWD